MHIANFFDKVALGASQLLDNFDRTEFENMLSTHRIQISFDESCLENSEGKSILDLLTRLLSRLYPRVYFDGPEALKKELEDLALTINPRIDISNNEPTINLVIGNTLSQLSVPTFYLGSSEWDCKFSCIKPMGSCNSGNPFGAGVAACMGAANVFRTVFKEQLPHSEVDSEFVLSLLNLNLTPSSYMPTINDFNLGKVHLIGLGAIGNSVLWALKNIIGLNAEVVGIEPEKIALSNLQRYALADQNSIGVDKIDIVSKYLSGTSVKFYGFPGKWSEYIYKEKNWMFDRLAICVDNADDRIFIQGSLPRKIFNAWTQRENLGVSRHLSFGHTPCLTCLYSGSLKKKNISQEIADNLKIPEQEEIIRKYLANRYPLDTPLLNIIKNANDLNDTKEFDKFLGQPVEFFHSEVVCGGVLLNLRGNSNNPSITGIEVPSAFESALAGILLAAELVKEKLNYVSHPTSSIRFNLIRSISPYLQFPETINQNCICSDEDFLHSYNFKWKNLTLLN